MGAGTMSTEAIFVRHYAEFAAVGGQPGRGVRHVEVEATTKARQYESLGTAYADFQPGNGTSYKVILHDLTRVRVDRETRGYVDGWDPEQHGEQPPDYERTTRNVVREGATIKDMAGRVGGELLVSLPENFGGVSFVLALPIYVEPWWLTSHTADRVRPADAVHLAAFLSFFSDAVAAIRDGEQVPA